PDQTGEFITTYVSRSSRVSIQPWLVAAPLYHSSTSSVTLTTFSPLSMVRTTALVLTARSLPAPRAPACFHSTFFGRTDAYCQHTPAPHGARMRRRCNF